MNSNLIPVLNQRRKVLIVDDELINRELLGAIMGEKYDVIYAGNGQEAYDKLTKGGEKVSVILLDLIMPVMNGFEFLEKVQGDSELRKIPVIVLTADRTAEVKSIQMGAVDFIPKPYDMPEVILARVTRSIELFEDTSLINATERDRLTGLFSHDYFFEYVQRIDQFEPGAGMDAIVFDINRFHMVNELYGRAYGDMVLKGIADWFRDNRSLYNGIACRAEADTFFIYGDHGAFFGNGIMEKLTEALGRSERTSRLHFRIGLYENADKSLSPEQRFDRALLACSHVTNRYESSCFIYDHELHRQERFRSKLLDDFESALREGQFTVFYQPKYDVTGEEPLLTSAEALVRWLHPEYGMVSPGLFVPLLEANGLIKKLDRFVWRQAATQIRSWKDRLGVLLPVSVNVSRTDLFDDRIESQLAEIVRDAGISTSELMLEITESAYTGNAAQIIERVCSLRSAGFKVEMDDFGSGYSSLNMLSEMPIDVLKLDMSFVHNIVTSAQAYRMMELMVEISDFLGVPVIAEGVETKEQCDLLKKMGCEIIQGYYFSKPVSPEEFEKFFKN